MGLITENINVMNS